MEYCFHLVLNEDQRRTLEVALKREIAHHDARVGDAPYHPVHQTHSLEVLEMLQTREPIWRLDAFSSREERLHKWKSWERCIFAQDALADLKAEDGVEARADAAFLQELIEDYMIAKEKRRKTGNRLGAIRHEMRKLQERDDQDGTARLRSEQETLEREHESVTVVELPEPSELGSRLPSAAKTDGRAARVPRVTGDLQMIEIDELQLGTVEGALSRMIEYCDEQLKDDPNSPYGNHKRNCERIFRFLNNRIHELSNLDLDDL